MMELDALHGSDGTGKRQDQDLDQQRCPRNYWHLITFTRQCSPIPGCPHDSMQGHGGNWRYDGRLVVALEDQMYNNMDALLFHNTIS